MLEVLLAPREGLLVGPSVSEPLLSGQGRQDPSLRLLRKSEVKRWRNAMHHLRLPRTA